MSQRIRIDPVTRLEGHGKIEIFLDDEGNVANAYFQTPELRGFERFVVGRAAEEMPVITNRICGICPEAHHLAAAKALDDCFDVTPPPAAVKLRELLYMAFYVTDHLTHFYALGAPDFLLGPNAPPAERNLLGVIRKTGVELGRQVLACRARNHEVMRILGGRAIHPTGGMPGGWGCSLKEEDRVRIEGFARENLAFVQTSLGVYHDLVEREPDFAAQLQSNAYLHRTYSIGTVDADNHTNFYDGWLRVVDQEGHQLSRFKAVEYLEHIVERTESWTYMKFPYLKKVGWKGFVEGPESGVYMSTPLSRLNVSDGMATPLAQAEFVRFYETLGSGRNGDGRFRPVHHRLATHWARLIEALYAAEHMLELATDAQITSTETRRIPERVKGVGIGQVEAPRGTLIHHYETDKRGVLKKVNLIVGTTHNHASIAMSIRRAAESFIRAGQVVEEGMLNRIEMAFRLYDPCLSCATHSLPGEMDLEVAIRDAAGRLMRVVRRSAP